MSESVGFAALAERWAGAAGEDLGGLLGGPVQLALQEVRRGPREALLPAAPLLHARLHTRDEPPQPVHLALPVPSGRALAAARLGVAPSEEGAAWTPEGELHDAFTEIVALAAAALGRVLAESVSAPGFELEGTRLLQPPLEVDAALAAGCYRRARFSLAVAGHAGGSLDLLVPEALAEAWFGAEEGLASAVESPPIAVIDPDPESRAQAEALAEALGRPVWTLDPAQYGPESLEQLAQSSAVVVAWDLGVCSGLELLETLASDGRTSGLPVAMAARSFTREQVLAALRFGARSVVHQPYQAEEIARRLPPPSAGDS